MNLYRSLATALKDRSEVRGIKLTLKGSFPLELFDLTELEEAYLEGDCAALPAPLSGWRKLRVLSVRWPGFRGDLSPLFTLPALENLKIIETPLPTFLLPLGNVPAPLRRLTVKGCGLTRLPEEISMLERLQELVLPENQLSELPTSFRELTQLRRLNLDRNAFTRFPDHVRLAPALRHLSIDGNAFSEEEKARIQREFHLDPN